MKIVILFLFVFAELFFHQADALGIVSSMVLHVVMFSAWYPQGTDASAMESHCFHILPLPVRVLYLICVQEIVILAQVGRVLL